MKRIRWTAALLAVLLGTSATRAADPPLRLHAAGSLTNAMTAMPAESGLSAAAPVFGPSGVLRERIEAGAPADLLASADMGQPRRLAAGGACPSCCSPVTAFAP